MKQIIPAVAASLIVSACQVSSSDGDNQTSGSEDANRAAEANPQVAERNRIREEARRPLQNVRFVVDKSDRRVEILQGDNVVRSHDVAIGTEDNPTPSGKWEFHRVDINPEWVPPDSEWAEDRERKAPGDPENPMGRARLVFKMPYTIHGTDATGSLGKAVSHGSIRVSNDVVLELAELLLRAGGSWEGDQWFRRMTENRDKEFQVKLEDPVPIEVKD